MLRLLLLFLLWPALAWGDCRSCHPQAWPTPAHAGTPCQDCHRGQPQEAQEQAAHRGLLASPGQGGGVGCGGPDCHGADLKALQHNRMQQVPGMLAATAQAFGEEPARSVGSLTNRGHQGYLRKLCVSCHLGTELVSDQPRLYWRGGGCLACHLGEPKDGWHRPLDLPRSNHRCFGCHSRSGRISMNYAGLAERATPQPGSLKLADGRPVVQRPPDAHSKARMLCTDCHTQRGVMGDGTLRPRGEQLEIACLDCHDQARKPPFRAQKYGSPLAGLRQKGERRFIHLKARAGLHPVPLVEGKNHPDGNHRRLSCEACHAQWAPQCYGCHVEYRKDARQWDHLEQQETPGRWQETGWDYQSRLPALGVFKGRIQPFVPGMVWSLDAPGNQRRASLYAPLSPHTTGPSRSCASCHQDRAAWGQVAGRSAGPGGKWALPRAWGALPGAETLHAGARRLSEQEVQKIKQVGTCLECHRGEEKIYRNFPSALKASKTALHKRKTAAP